jgi:hypothetical protein
MHPGGLWGRGISWRAGVRDILNTSCRLEGNQGSGEVGQLTLNVSGAMKYRDESGLISNVRHKSTEYFICVN